MSITRRLAIALSLLALAAAASEPPRVAIGQDDDRPQQPLGGTIEVCIFGAGDVPTTQSLSGGTVLPSQVFQYEGNPPAYTTVLTVPGEPRLAGIFKLDVAGGWLFSLESPSTLGGALTSAARPGDIVQRDGNDDYTMFFCGATVSGVVPSGSRIDAFYLEGGDDGDLIVSFDVPTFVGSSAFEPSDLVRYTPTGGGTCSSWQIAATNPVFDASAAGAGIPLASNAIGVSSYAGLQVFSPDIPTVFSPPGLTVVPGQLVAWDGATYSMFATLAGWPISSNLNGIAGPGNPGRVVGGLLVGKGPTPGNLTVYWTPSCSQNAGDYALYEGAIGNWSSHLPVTCTDAGADLLEALTPGSGDRYFLVVASNPQGEGSYGAASSGAERPVSADPCQTPHIVTTCPQ